MTSLICQFLLSYYYRLKFGSNLLTFDHKIVLVLIKLETNCLYDASSVVNTDSTNVVTVLVELTQQTDLAILRSPKTVYDWAILSV